MTIGWVGRSIGLPWMISFSDQNFVSPVGMVFLKLIPIAEPFSRALTGREDSGTVAAKARRAGPRRSHDGGQSPRRDGRSPSGGGRALARAPAGAPAKHRRVARRGGAGVAAPGR